MYYNYEIGFDWNAQTLIWDRYAFPDGSGKNGTLQVSSDQESSVLEVNDVVCFNVLDLTPVTPGAEPVSFSIVSMAVKFYDKATGNLASPFNAIELTDSFNGAATKAYGEGYCGFDAGLHPYWSPVIKQNQAINKGDYEFEVSLTIQNSEGSQITLTKDPEMFVESSG